MSDQSEVLAAIRQIAAERKIELDVIITAIEDAIKHSFVPTYEPEVIDVEMDAEEGTISVYVNKNVVKTVENQDLEISLKDAKKIDSSLKVGDKVQVEVTAEGDFGRIAAQSARQAILQTLRDSEKKAAIESLQDKVGTLETVTIQRITRDGDVLCEINRARAVMPKAERVPTEFYKLGSRVKVLLKSIEEDVRGEYILISRADKEFLKQLFVMEIPEIDSGTVEIVSIAREAGSRSKVAVKSNSDGVDPIGSCIGQRGVRINAIMNELKLGQYEEKVDVILYEEDTKAFIANAIRPAEALKVTIEDDKAKSARILVSPEQHSLAIGAGGQNARLANVLTGWDITIESEGGEEQKEEELTEEAESSEPRAEIDDEENAVEENKK
jgi:N utilization substance protein A